MRIQLTPGMSHLLLKIETIYAYEIKLKCAYFYSQRHLSSALHIIICSLY